MKGRFNPSENRKATAFGHHSLLAVVEQGKCANDKDQGEKNISHHLKTRKYRAVIRLTLDFVS
jgi:hypothetical protein